MKKIPYPKWHDEARALRDQGVSRQQIAVRLGITQQTLSHILADKWRSYLLMNRSGKRPRKIANFEDLTGLEFVPVDVARGQFLDVKDFNTEGEMADRLRQFESISKVEDGRRWIGHRIVCCKCGKTEDYYPINSSISPRFAERQFKREGWIVGASPRNDICPDDAKPMRSKKENQMITEVASGKLTEELGPIGTKLVESLNQGVEANPPATFLGNRMAAPVRVEAVAPAPKIPVVAPPVPAAPVAAEPARSMDKADKRIIFTKLNDVYQDEEHGYSADWTDAKVAADLGVPVEWVAEIRELDFGPEFNAVAQTKAMEELASLQGKIDRSIAIVEAKFQRMEGLDQKIDAAIKDAKASNDRLEELLRNLNASDAQISNIVREFNSYVDEYKKIRQSMPLKPSAK